MMQKASPLSKWEGESQRGASRLPQVMNSRTEAQEDSRAPNRCLIYKKGLINTHAMGRGGGEGGIHGDSWVSGFWLIVES